MLRNRKVRSQRHVGEGQRGELDAYYAHLYGLTRDELRYILDPKEVYGEDLSTRLRAGFPGETFRMLKERDWTTPGRQS